MNLDFARRWAHALGNDMQALGDLYAEDFTLEHTMVDDHVDDTITNRAMLGEALGALANQDPGNGVGIYTFEATKYTGDARYGLIEWDVTIEHAESFRGIPAGGRTLAANGSTFVQFDADGRIVLESTFWNDNPIFETLGVPIARPHYWDEDFDPAALATA